MKSTLALLILMSFHFVVCGQNEIIKLEPIPIHFSARNFYIEDVVDARANQENIGFVQKGAFNRKVNAELEGGVEYSVCQYLEEALEQDTTGTPIVIRVVHLAISEHTGFTETGRAEAALEFYKSENGELGKVYEADAFVEIPGIDVTRGHENRIRTVITACLEKFNRADWQSSTPFFTEKENIDTMQVAPEAGILQPQLLEAPRWNNLITFSRLFGTNGDGWSLAYCGFVINDKNDWFFPMTISLESYSIDPFYFSKWDYYEARLSYYMPGLSAFRKLTPEGNLYANFSLMIPVGSEQLTDFGGSEYTHFIIGVAPTQGIYFIPKSNFGITVGMSVYERLLTSRVYKSDLGIKAEIGIKF